MRRLIPVTIFGRYVEWVVQAEATSVDDQIQLLGGQYIVSDSRFTPWVFLFRGDV